MGDDFATMDAIRGLSYIRQVVDPEKPYRLLIGSLVQKIRADYARLAEIESKLYPTTDGVRVVPNVDPVWIDPDEDDGWFGEPRDYGRFDEDDNRVAPEPIKLTRWVAHKDDAGAWDHLWMLLPDDPWRPSGDLREYVGDHWDGNVWSTREACLAARTSEGGGAKPRAAGGGS